MNAGFILTANDKGKLLKIKGVDEAALAILRSVDYTGLSVPDAAGALVSISAKQHYLSDANRYILISIWDMDDDNARKLLADISKEANSAAKSAKIDPEVLGQYLEAENLVHNAERLGITAGRQQLIDIVLKFKPSYTPEQLARYNIENLLRIARAADISLPISGYRIVDIKPVSVHDVNGGDLK